LQGEILPKYLKHKVAGISSDHSYLKTAILVDQPGTFVVVSTLGIFVAAFYSKGNPNAFEIIKKVFLFPPFIAFLVACLLNVLQFN
jgi:predicted permease